MPASMDREAKDLVERLLLKDPRRRLGSLNGWLDVKSHSYFKDIEWDNLDSLKVMRPNLFSSL